jgi:hypothetical protein
MHRETTLFGGFYSAWDRTIGPASAFEEMEDSVQEYRRF